MPSGVGLTPIFVLLIVLMDAQAAQWMLGLLAVAVFVGGMLSADALLSWISRHILWVAGITGGMLCIGTLVVYRNHPLSMDEYAAYFQSQVFASGALAGHWPVPLMDWLLPPGFQNYFLSVSKATGEVASAYWPSFSLLLAPFTAAGVPWACNPVISALTLVVAYRLSMAIRPSREAAALVVLLTVASPAFLINGISYYSMPAHLLANSLFALLLVEPTRFKSALAGVIGSIALTLHNPFPHLLFSIPWFVWLLRRPDGVRLTLCLMAGYVPLCLPLAVGWLSFTGHLRYAGLAAASGKDFGSMLPLMSVFSLPEPIVLVARLMGLVKLWIWAVPGLLVLAVGGAWESRSNPALRVLTASAILTLVGYCLVPVDQGHGWGSRYFHSAWIVLPLLAAHALTRIDARDKPGFFEDADARTFAIACSILTLLVSGLLFAVQVRDFVSMDLAQLPAYAGTERRIVLVDTSYSYYGADLVQNDPWLRGSEIRMLSHGHKENARMMAEKFPGAHAVFRDHHGEVWALPPGP